MVELPFWKVSFGTQPLRGLEAGKKRKVQCDETINKLECQDDQDRHKLHHDESTFLLSCSSMLALQSTGHVAYAYLTTLGGRSRPFGSETISDRPKADVASLRPVSYQGGGMEWGNERTMHAISRYLLRLVCMSMSMTRPELTNGIIPCQRRDTRQCLASFAIRVAKHRGRSQNSARAHGHSDRVIKYQYTEMTSDINISLLEWLDKKTCYCLLVHVVLFTLRVQSFLLI